MFSVTPSTGDVVGDADLDLDLGAVTPVDTEALVEAAARQAAALEKADATGGAAAEWKEVLEGSGGEVVAGKNKVDRSWRQMVVHPDPAIAKNQTDWPLWWFAPFFDRTSFGKEAATLVLGAMRWVPGFCWGP